MANTYTATPQKALEIKYCAQLRKQRQRSTLAAYLAELARYRGRAYADQIAAQAGIWRPSQRA